jgi:hypothetical protein
MANGKIAVGRPRLLVDFAIVLRLRDVENLGWLRMAEAYREITGQYISRDTIKRRYLEAKAQEAAGTIPLIDCNEGLFRIIGNRAHGAGC